MNDYRIIGYHGTKKSVADEILNRGFLIKEAKLTDNHWLGHGIYFYDDFKLAKSWADTKVKNHNNKYNLKEESCVIKANIFGNNICDLDDNLEVDKFLSYFNQLYPILEQNHSIELKDKSHYEKIQIYNCIVLDYYTEINNIDVIIRTYDSKRTRYYEKEHNLDYNIKKLLRITHIEKQICVKNEDLISNMEIV